MIELAVICALLVALNAWQMVDRRRERQEVRVERADLLQRIQAPQHAITQHHNAGAGQFAPPAVDPEIDEDFWVSKEDLAELAARGEAS
jgi:hypothetical protein